MTLVTRREPPARAALAEIEEFVKREECARALARLDRLGKLRLDQEERRRALLLRCWTFLEAQDWNGLASCIEPALQVTPEDLELRLMRAHWLAHTGQERQAIRQARLVARDTSSEEHLARVAMIVGLALFRSRHFSWGIRFSEKAEAYYRWVDSFLLASWVSINIGLCHKALCHFDVALEYIRKSGRTLRGHGYAVTKSRACLNEGVVLLQLGEIAMARAAFNRALALNEASSDLHKCLVQDNLGHTFRMQGDFTTALEFYEEAHRVASRAKLLRQECISLFWIGETHLESNDLDRAAAALEAARRIAGRLKHGGLRLEVWRRLTEYHMRRADRSAARRCLQRALRLSKTLSQPRDRALIRRTQLLLADASLDEASVQDLIDRFRRVGDRYEFSKTVLLVFEALDWDPRRSPYLVAAETEARFYIAAMGLVGWQKRLDAAADRIVGRPLTAREFEHNKRAFERARIEAALERSGGLIAKAAELLGTGRNTLARKMRQHGIERRRYWRRSRIETSPP